MKISIDSSERIGPVLVNAEYVQENNGLYRIYIAHDKSLLAKVFLFTIHRVTFYISDHDSISPLVHDKSYFRKEYLFERVNGNLSLD